MPSAIHPITLVFFIHKTGGRYVNLPFTRTREAVCDRLWGTANPQCPHFTKITRTAGKILFPSPFIRTLLSATREPGAGQPLLAGGRGEHPSSRLPSNGMATSKDTELAFYRCPFKLLSPQLCKREKNPVLPRCCRIHTAQSLCETLLAEPEA